MAAVPLDLLFGEVHSFDTDKVVVSRG